MNRQPSNTTYNQQTNNQYNDRRSAHSSRTRMVFNGPIHGYIQHVSSDGPVVAYSEVTYVQPGRNKTTITRTVATNPPPGPPITSPHLPIEMAPAERHDKEVTLDDLIPPSIPLPVDIERSELEKEFQNMSPQMKSYIGGLFRQYVASYTEAHKDGQDCQR